MQWAMLSEIKAMMMMMMMMISVSTSYLHSKWLCTCLPLTQDELQRAQLVLHSHALMTTNTT